MQIVPVEQIPINVVDCPEDKLVEVYRTCKQMHLVCKKHNGVGLSAVQVGIPWRLFVIGEGDGPYRNFLNCKYGQVGDGKFESVEGCLSIKRPNGDLQHFKVDRFQEIQITGRELVEKDNSIQLIAFQAKLSGTNLLNVVFQHEIDHQNLVLISDIGTEYEIL